MSRGPGHVQRAILDLIAAPAAMQTHIPGDYPGHPAPGPVGVPMREVYAAAFGTRTPTRSQKVSTARAIRGLREKRLADTCLWPWCWCTTTPHIAEQSPCPHCGARFSHPWIRTVGRWRNDAEQAAYDERMEQSAAFFRALMGARR